MNFPLVYEYKFDSTASNLENRIEKEPLTTQPGLWNRVIIPRHAPFFAEEGLELFFKDTTPMVEGTHYRIHRMMGRLTEYCGKPVACMIELLQEDTTDVLVSYHTVGTTTLFDRTFLYLVMSAINDDRPALWDNMTGKPTVFPPKFHGHSLIYEMNSFADMIKLFDEIVGYLKTQHVEIIDVKLDKIVDLIDWYVDLYATMLRNFLQRHMSAYDSHGLTAEQVGLEKVDNFATSTLLDALRGMSDNTHLTLTGLRVLMQEFGYSKNAFLENNLLPLSQYGTRNFIPPAIDGSFEGLGSKYETSGICLEADGTISVITNHFDGRVDGLYYSVGTGYPDNIQLNYTGYRYQHPRLEADNIVPNAIVGGSNDELIMVGKAATNAWYLGLSKGTFNPAKHVLSKIDITPLAQDMGLNPASYSQFDALSVHLMGRWIYLIQTNQVTYYNYLSPDLGPNCLKRFYRVLASDVEAGGTVVPQRVNITYTDWDGVTKTNQALWQWATPVLVGGNKLSRGVFTFSPPANYGNMLYRSPLTFSAPIPNDSKNWVLKFMSHFWVSYSGAGFNSSFSATPELIYQFDPETATMVLMGKTPEQVIDMSKGSQAYDNQVGVAISGLVANSIRQSGTVLNDGNVLVGYSDSNYQYPHGLRCLKTGVRSAYEALSKPWTRSNFPNASIQSTLEEPISPLISSIRPSRVSYDPEGEFYNASSQNSIAVNNLYHRTLTGDYQVREGITNVNYPNMRSRPLTNAIRKCNVSNMTPKVSVSGEASKLAYAGVPMGFTSFGMGVNNKYLKLNPGNGNVGWSTVTEDTAIRMVTNHRKDVLADGTVNITPLKEVYYPTDIINKLYDLMIPVAYKNTPNKACTIVDLQDGGGAKFGGFPVMAIVQYLDLANTTHRAAFATLNVSYSAQSGIRLTVQDVSLIQLTDSAIRDTQQNTSPTYWELYAYPAIGGNILNTQVYIKADDTLDVYIFTGIYSQFNGDSSAAAVRANVDRAGGIVSKTFYSHSNHISLSRFAVPGVGIVQGLDWASSSGGSGMIGLSDAGNYYLLGSCYPESGWVIYFQKEQEVVFNGALYTLAMGTIDLRDIDTDPRNKTFYIYVQLSAGVPEYTVSLQKMQDSPFRMWVGEIQTNDKQILNINRFNVFTLNGYRVSETKRGNAIPASSGSITGEGQIAWLRSSEVISG